VRPRSELWKSSTSSSRSGVGPTPGRSDTWVGAPRTWTPPSPSGARWCARTGSSCRPARASWPTRTRRASSGRPKTRRRRCSRRWRSPRPGGELYLPLVFKLLSTTGEQSIDLQPDRTIVVGRAVTSDVPIYDPTISRRHAELSLTDGGVRVKDVGSSNGTFLNGARIGEATATENDVITFGKVAFHVKNVDRVSILLLEETSGELVPRISRARTEQSSASKHVPQSIARMVVEGRVAILSDNTAADERFKGKSILIQSVRSAMCTPLMGTDQKVLGILYVDNLTATHSFSDDDLKFLIAFGSLAAVAIENSKRSERLRRE